MKIQAFVLRINAKMLIGGNVTMSVWDSLWDSCGEISMFSHEYLLAESR